MDAQNGDIEQVTLTDILQLATWNRERSDDELRSFINTRHAALADGEEIE
jgi:hypothetical protein